MIVVGLDLSLTATGWAKFTEAGTMVGTIRSTGPKDAPPQDTAYRLGRITDRCAELAQDTDAVIIEGPSYGQMRQGGEHARAGLWWMVVHRLTRRAGPSVVVITPAQLKKYATGKGNAAKEQVLLAVARRYPDVPVADNNMADALVLAAIGRRLLGQPIDDLPQTHLAALAKVPAR